MSGLPLIATEGADIAVRQLRARFGLKHRSKQLKLFDHYVGAGEQKISPNWLA